MRAEPATNEHVFEVRRRSFSLGWLRAYVCVSFFSETKSTTFLKNEGRVDSDSLEPMEYSGENFSSIFFRVFEIFRGWSHVCDEFGDDLSFKVCVS